MKIVSVGHGNRKFGKLANLFSTKLNYGLIRLGHHVYSFDDREVARGESPFKSKFGGTRRANGRFMEVLRNFKPQLVFLGHADIISPATIRRCKETVPEIRFGHWTVDAFYRPKNARRFEAFSGVVDALFATTGGAVIAAYKKPENRVAYMPNAVDRAIDCHRNDQKEDLDIDLLFCGSPSRHQRRGNIVEQLSSDPRLSSLRFEIRGMLGNPLVYGEAYDRLLGRARMALNISKENESPLYSSDRISQLMGNGILTFIPESTGLRKIIADDEAVFFSNYEDLRDKILHFHAHDDLRIETAEKGRLAAHGRFSSERVAGFMVDLTIGKPVPTTCEWKEHVFL